MPQLVKGGKYVYGWALVDKRGKIPIPPEAVTGYYFPHASRVIIMTGSATSGGFCITTPPSLQFSPIGSVLHAQPELSSFTIPEGKAIEYRGRVYCWTRLCNGCVLIPPRTLRAYGINPGDRLLCMRGSHPGIGFALQGPLVECAERYDALSSFK